MLVKTQILSLFLDRDLKEELWVNTLYFQTISVSSSHLVFSKMLSFLLHCAATIVVHCPFHEMLCNPFWGLANIKM